MSAHSYIMNPVHPTAALREKPRLKPGSEVRVLSIVPASADPIASLQSLARVEWLPIH